MKIFIANVMCLAGMLTAWGGMDSAAAGTSVGTALEVFAKARGEKATRGVLAVRGVRGQDQPEKWEVIVRDSGSGGTTAYLVDGKGIVKSGRLRENVGGVPVELDRLRIDSPEAFRIADAEARKAQLGFDSLDYELRSQAGGSAPVWHVRMRDAAGREVAAVEISGSNGGVMGGTWGGNGANGGGTGVAAATRRPVPGETEIEESAGAMRSGSQQWVGGASDREHGKKSTPEGHREAMGDLWARSTNGIESAGTSARTGFKNVGTSFADIFRGRAEFRSTGKQRWSPNRGAASGGR